MSPTLLVPLDGSPLAARAVPYAVAAARHSGGRLILMRVLMPPGSLREPVVQEPVARADLERVAAQARADTQGLPVDIEITSSLLGNVADNILVHARKRGADLVILSTHGRGGLGRWLYGSVADEVLRRADVPLLLVPPACERAWPRDSGPRMLVALDGSALSNQALGPITATARALGAEIVLLRVIAPSGAEAAAYLYEDRQAEEAEARKSLELAADRLQSEGLKVSTQTAVGVPWARIIAAAHDVGADLVAMATHGRSGVARTVMGSVATETLRHTTVPLLLVPLAAVGDAQHPPAEASASTMASAQPLRLLVALDVSARAQDALLAAKRIAHASGAEVILLNVFRPALELGRVVAATREERMTYARNERELFLRDQAARLEGLNVRTWVEACRSHEEIDSCIARVAAEAHADLVLIATTNVAGVRGLLGGTAQGVLRQSPVPLVVVSQHAPE
jgi:nucleotide-binding universal stress UspA family protein